MKKVGLIFAMDEELEALKKYVKIKKTYEIFDLKFYETTIGGVECILVKCGIGKVNAARCTQILIDNNKLDYIFNIGVAGGISNKLNVGDIVIGTRLYQHDFDITAFNHKLGYIPNIGEYVECDKYLVSLAENTLEELDINSLSGAVTSGDVFCTDKGMAEEIHKNFNALCVEMEGSAVGQVSYLCNIPFLVMRSISDTPNNNNKITYEEFLEKSADNVAKSIYKLIEKI